MSRTPEKPGTIPSATSATDDDEPDPWDKRISDTGCAGENEKLNNCFYDKKDWRLCRDEMAAFRACWQRQGNAQRTDTKDNTP